MQTGPIGRVALFPISASIWSRYSGDGTLFYSVTLQRTYKDAQGAWQYTNSFGPNDLLVLSECARLAYLEINRMRARERASQSNGHEPQGEF